MIEKLELGAQRGPKSLAAVKAEVSQTRQMMDVAKEEKMEDNSSKEEKKIDLLDFWSIIYWHFYQYRSL